MWERKGDIRPLRMRRSAQGLARRNVSPVGLLTGACPLGAWRACAPATSHLDSVLPSAPMPRMRSPRVPGRRFTRK